MTLFKDDNVYQPYEIRSDLMKCRIIIEYDPKLMLKSKPIGVAEIAYQLNLDNIREHVDFCVKRSLHALESLENFSADQSNF